MTSASTSSAPVHTGTTPPGSAVDILGLGLTDTTETAEAAAAAAAATANEPTRRPSGLSVDVPPTPSKDTRLAPSPPRSPRADAAHPPLAAANDTNAAATSALKALDTARRKSQMKLNEGDDKESDSQSASMASLIAQRGDGEGADPTSQHLDTIPDEDEANAPALKDLAFYPMEVTKEPCGFRKCMNGAVVVGLWAVAATVMVLVLNHYFNMKVAAIAGGCYAVATLLTMTVVHYCREHGELQYKVQQAEKNMERAHTFAKAYNAARAAHLQEKAAFDAGKANPAASTKEEDTKTKIEAALIQFAQQKEAEFKQRSDDLDARAQVIEAKFQKYEEDHRALQNTQKGVQEKELDFQEQHSTLTASSKKLAETQARVNEELEEAHENLDNAKKAHSEAEQKLAKDRLELESALMQLKSDQLQLQQDRDAHQAIVQVWNEGESDRKQVHERLETDLKSKDHELSSKATELSQAKAQIQEQAEQIEMLQRQVQAAARVIPAGGVTIDLFGLESLNNPAASVSLNAESSATPSADPIVEPQPQKPESRGGTPPKATNSAGVPVPLPPASPPPAQPPAKVVAAASPAVESAKSQLAEDDQKLVHEQVYLALDVFSKPAAKFARFMLHLQDSVGKSPEYSNKPKIDKGEFTAKFKVGFGIYLSSFENNKGAFLDIPSTFRIKLDEGKWKVGHQFTSSFSVKEEVGKEIKERKLISMEFKPESTIFHFDKQHVEVQNSVLYDKDNVHMYTIGGDTTAIRAFKEAQARMKGSPVKV